MKDLLTKEECRELEAIREKVSSRMGYHPRTQSESREAINQERARSRQLLTLVDNLSKRGVKKYSEEELLAAFRAMIQRNVILLTAEQATMAEAGWLDCARFLGALEEK